MDVIMRNSILMLSILTGSQFVQELWSKETADTIPEAIVPHMMNCDIIYIQFRLKLSP